MILRIGSADDKVPTSPCARKYERSYVTKSGAAEKKLESFTPVRTQKSIHYSKTEIARKKRWKEMKISTKSDEKQCVLKSLKNHIFRIKFSPVFY